MYFLGSGIKETDPGPPDGVGIWRSLSKRKREGYSIGRIMTERPKGSTRKEHRHEMEKVHLKEPVVTSSVVSSENRLIWFPSVRNGP